VALDVVLHGGELAAVPLEPLRGERPHQFQHSGLRVIAARQRTPGDQRVRH